MQSKDNKKIKNNSLYTFDIDGARYYLLLNYLIKKIFPQNKSFCIWCIKILFESMF